MGPNTAPTVGRLRTTHGIANTLPRLRRDAELARALAVKMEEGFIKPEVEDEGSQAGENAAVPAGAASTVEPGKPVEGEGTNGAEGAQGGAEDVKMAEGVTEGKDARDMEKDKGIEKKVDLAEEGWHSADERPSEVVKQVIERLIREKGLEDEDGLTHEQLIQKVSCDLDSPLPPDMTLR